MGISRHYLKEHKFMLTKISEELFDQNLMQHVIALNSETEGVVQLRELADLRETKSLDRLTVRGTIAASQTEANRPESLLAILVPDSTLLFGMARAYQTFSKDKRQAVQIFKDPLQALTWLSQDAQEMEVLSDFVNNA